ncbi:methyltransferase domain-containing protein [Anaerotignum sp.]|uniref:methyltransferase domain-containing protein n=1 Tax=Anaerotignum sp. TaxID=2039241 RepID=UPI0028998F3D|nr:methyltransferase domain-containing protein [Anaerotignum sp.]
MPRNDEIRNAYKTMGGGHTFYDGMITCSTFLGKTVCKMIWGMNQDENNRYLQLALQGIPSDFSGKMLEVPVGTGILTMPIYARLQKSEIICLDYSKEMMARAQHRADAMHFHHVTLCQGDVGALNFPDETFDLVLSLNGFHAFPDKEGAYKEIFRVLKPQGIFCGCFYVQGERKRTDWFIERFYVPKGFFTPPFETKQSLEGKLQEMYDQVQLNCVGAMASFTCIKGK